MCCIQPGEKFRQAIPTLADQCNCRRRHPTCLGNHSMHAMQRTNIYKHIHTGGAVHFSSCSRHSLRRWGPQGCLCTSANNWSNPPCSAAGHTKQDHTGLSNELHGTRLTFRPVDPWGERGSKTYGTYFCRCMSGRCQSAVERLDVSRQAAKVVREKKCIEDAEVLSRNVEVHMRRSQTEVAACRCQNQRASVSVKPFHHSSTHT